MKRPPKKPQPRPAAKLPPSPARQWFFRLTALVVIPLLLLAATEAVLRLAGYGYDPALFKKITIGNSQFLVNNETFGLRFFPPQLTRGTSPIRMPVHKSAGTYRIFILGESAAMGDPEPSFGAGRYLEALLDARYPEAHFEIINTGITAINSIVILPIARDCANADGDLWIIYMGNNEMVGPFGAATVFGAKAPPLAFVRLNLAIEKLRVGQLLVELGRKLKGSSAAAPSWGGMEMFVGNQLRADDPRKEVVYHNFSRNLKDIVKTGLNSGAKILLNTVAVNLKDCAPFATMLNSNLPPPARAQFGQDITNAVREQEGGQIADAVRDFGSAAALDPQAAELQFRWGESLLQITNYPAAREHLQAACDDDALPFRTDSRLNGIIAATGRELANANLIMFDSAAALAVSTRPASSVTQHFLNMFISIWTAIIDSVAPGQTKWREFCRAEITRDAITNSWASQSACDLRLGLSDWNRELVWKNVIGRFEQPPLSSQLDNTARLNDLQSRLKALQTRMNAADARHADADFQAALRGAPDDFLLHANYAAFLQASTGNLPAATVQWQQAHDLLPQDYLACFELGRMTELQGQWPEAEEWFRRAVQLRPTLTEGLTDLGKVLAKQEKYADALAIFAAAQKQRPEDWQVHFLSGKTLAKLNRHAEATEQYRAALKLNPANWETHFELGGELDSTNQLDAALVEFGEAARLNPGNARNHFNYGVLLAKLNRLDEAQRQFEESLRLDPTYSKAGEYLSQMESLRQRGR